MAWVLPALLGKEVGLPLIAVSVPELMEKP